MTDDFEAGLIRSYRETLSAFSQLIEMAERLVSAQRGGQSMPAVELTAIALQLGQAKAKMATIDRYLALFPNTDGHVH